MLKSLSDYGDYGDSTERSCPVPIQSYNQMRVQSDFEDRKRWILTHDFTSLNCYVRFYEMCAAILSLYAHVCQNLNIKFSKLRINLTQWKTNCNFLFLFAGKGWGPGMGGGGGSGGYICNYVSLNDLGFRVRRSTCITESIFA